MTRSIYPIMSQETVYTRLRDCCQKYPQRPVIHEVRNSSCLTKTYQELLDEIHLLAFHLTKLDLPVGTKVGLISENRYEWLVAYCASIAMGFTVVPIDSRLTPGEWSTILNHAEVRMLFFSDAVSEKIAQLLETFSAEHLIKLGNSDSRVSTEVSYCEIMQTAKNELPSGFTCEQSQPEEIASIIYTSGTTGLPKAVQISHRNMLYTSQNSRRLSNQPGKITATVVPLNHIYGFIAVVSMALGGEATILYPTIDLQLLLRSFQELRPNHIIGIPALYEAIAKSIEKKLYDALPFLGHQYVNKSIYGLFGESALDMQILKKFVFKMVHDQFGGRVDCLSSAGAPLEPRIGRLFNILGLPILEGYGLTETTATVTFNDLNSNSYKLESVGRPFAETQVKINNPDSSGIGEIFVKGPGVSKGYYKNPSANQEAFDSDGWFKTGDLGYLDSSGFLFLTGRSKEMIVTPSGKKVFPSDLEKVLGQIPLVKEFCIFGVPYKEGSRAEKTHIQLVPDFEEARRRQITDVESFIKEAILEKCRGLPEHQKLRSFGFSNTAFPRTATLKIKKLQVRDAYLNREEKVGDSISVFAGDAVLESPLGKQLQMLISAHAEENVAGTIRSSSSLTLDLGFDSLTLLTFWCSLEEHFHISVPEEKTHELGDVGAVLHYLETHPDIQGHQFDATDLETKAMGGWESILSNGSAELQRQAAAILSSYALIRPLFLMLFRKFFELFCSLRIKGLENLPSEGPFILAPNHECHLDSIFVASMLPDRVQNGMAVIGASYHFEKPISRAIAKICHVIPVERERVSSALLQAGLEVLKQGKVLLVHPEGTRSANGELLPLKPGVGLLASFQRCPVVPIHIEGAHEFWPKDAKFPRSRNPITISIGTAIYPVTMNSAEESHDLMKSAQMLTQQLKESLLSLRMAPSELDQYSRLMRQLAEICTSNEQQGESAPVLVKTRE